MAKIRGFMANQASDAQFEPHATHSSSLTALTIGAIGVVYGDIGTSPLYAFQEALTASQGLHGVTNALPTAIARETVLGVLSLILWSLIIVVTLKYVILLLKADNNGEGGTLSLMSLALRGLKKGNRYVMLLGVIGAAMFYGDSVITPAISVLSAVEGLKLVSPVFNPFVLPITFVILTALFVVQARGTASVANFFGPIMVIWFVTMGVLGVYRLSENLSVVAAINPQYALLFVSTNGKIALITMGAVFLAVTGGEALYADLGHFGKKPIQVAWFSLVFPCLMLNYFGQGALILSDPGNLDKIFFKMAPDWALVPLILLAACATVIASQAVITGAFSLTRQAIQIGLLPRMEIRHTSAEHSGQIYLPRVNMLLFIGVIILVALFKSSSSLASAYGIAVTTAMVVDSVLAFIVIWRIWGYKPLTSALLVVPLIMFEGVFWYSNLLKIFDGAWVPIAMAAVLIGLMITWRRGTRILSDKSRRIEVPLEGLVSSLTRKPPHLVKGTAVFLTSNPETAPVALMHNLKHNKVLHEKNVVLTIKTVDTPRVSESERVKITPLNDLFSQVNVSFGYMEQPNVPKALGLCRKAGWKYDIMSTSFFLSRRSLKVAATSLMPAWQDKIFIALAKNANDASTYFQIPTGRVVEVGTQVSV
jgi:KUP system potassium uptake protein